MSNREPESRRLRRRGGLLRSVGRLGAFTLLSALLSSCFAQLAWGGEKKPPKVPEWQIDASWQGSRRGSPSTWYRLQHRGRTIAGQPSESGSQGGSSGQSEGASSAGEASKPQAPGNPGSEAKPETSGNAEDLREYSDLRITGNWSSESEGPDLWRMHWGGHTSMIPLGLNSKLPDLTGAIEFNTTQNLDAISYSIGVEHPMPMWLRPSDTWAHYLLLGLDLERANSAGVTTHGNLDLEAFWGYAFAERVEGTVARTVAEKEATLAVTRGAESNLPPLRNALARAPGVLATVLDALLPSAEHKLDLGEPDPDTREYGVTLHSYVLKRGQKLDAQDFGSQEVKVKALFEEFYKSTKRPDADRGPMWWDLLALTESTKALGGVYFHVLERQEAKECEFDSRFANNFRRALRNMEMHFRIVRGSSDTVVVRDLRIVRYKDPKAIATPQNLINVLADQVERYRGRVVPTGVVCLEYIGWVPVGGGEDYPIRGSWEPRIIYRVGHDSKLGLVATYKYGHERSTRTKRVSEWFVGFTYSIGDWAGD